MECLPSRIPEQLDVDVSGLHINQHVSIKDLQTPEGVLLLDDPDQIWGVMTRSLLFPGAIGLMLAGVLADLSMTSTLDTSLKLGGKVLGRMDNVAKLHKKQVEQAGFVVLKSPDIPSILVETAFISNSQEEKRLRDKNEQTRLASSILLGIKAYFNDNAPPGTLLAQSSGAPGADSVKHVISRGDTLSGIADRYNVSIRQLRQTNGLRNDRIRVGQVLTIPAS